jgi:uncharacterized delta-60 repeat protein
MTTTKLCLTAALLLGLACGDDVKPSSPDAGGDADAAPDEPDAGSFVTPEPFAVELSATGPDQLQAATAGPDGSFYAVGFAAAAVDAIRAVVVVKLTAGGGLDDSFGDGGVFTTPLEFRGGSDELDIGVQPSGRIIVSATVANQAEPLDRDIAVLGLTAAGAVDEEFGEDGVLVIDLNSAIIDGEDVTGADGVRSMAIDAEGRFYLHAYQRGLGLFDGNPRTDTDFAALRIDAEGVGLDGEFADEGVHLVDIRGGVDDIPSNATARGIHLAADGTVLAGGYATTEGLGEDPQPVLYALDEDGAPITEFATDGVFHSVVLGVQTEIYNFVVHGTHIVTAGYGRDSGEQNDWVSLRFEVATGDRDLSWGGAPGGAIVIDASGMMVGDNCRNAVGLPGGKTLLMGSTGPGNMPAQDAVFAVLDAEGQLDTAYGDGVHVMPFGAGEGGNDAFWGGAVSGDNVLLVGFRGGGVADEQTAELNDDAHALLLPVR